ncbi:SagB/ThcOx family dehydrogenase [Pseudomonas sp. REP124]|uniref:SagB family peptide dehydrogenase n=1 Tax=Pseudomonas sp. REP124 TaxID=2875731 RepID=UPI001CCE96E5|nr:SagB family peptide dehydrogenase [Pseudomonas sp. REP124]MBZ9784644.1 SagB/ThcOx family dehydrogenase [Pseudomonas sp. REP124]
MNINPYLFMLPRTPNLIIWDYKNHRQFELNQNYSNRLTELIENPNSYNKSNTIDADLLAAKILTTAPIEAIEWGWDDLSKIFHIGTKNIPCEQPPKNIDEWSKRYFDHCTDVLSRPSPEKSNLEQVELELLELPKASVMERSITDVLLDRKTCRTFTGEAISLETLSTILYLTLGYLHEREKDIEEIVAKAFRARRSSPSGGGLNACEGFLYVQNVIGLKPGIYSYHPRKNAISFVNPLPCENLGQLLCGQHFVNNLPFGLFITCRFDKLWWKYEHSRAYRMAYVEAGHISQTFQLVATSMGLNTWLTGALTDDQVEALLGLECSTEQPLFFVGCGRSDGQVMCKELNALIDNQGLTQ